MDPVAEQHHQERVARIENALRARDRNLCLAAFTLLLAACGGLALVQPPGEVQWGLLAGLIVAYAVFWQIDFEVGPVSTTPLQVLFVPMWFAVPPALLPLAAVASQSLGEIVGSLMTGRGHTGRRVLLSGTFAWYALGPAAVLAAFDVRAFDIADLPIYGLALASQFAVDHVATAVRMRFTGGSRTPLAQELWIYSIDAGLAPIGFLVALGQAQLPWAALAVLPLGLLLAQFAKERDERILHALELSSAYRGTAQLMGDVLEADDAYTGGEHTKGVVGLALAIGQQIDLGPRAMRDLEFGALLHDIGKLRVPNEIINKPGKLNDEEWAIIKQHPGFGQEMLDQVGGELSRAGVIVRAHHERWDGGGYPDGLRGEEIPIEARIITVCDSFSAMTTDRSYRKGMSHEEALQELQRCSGTQFDPTLVRALHDALAVAPVHPRPVLVEDAAPADATVPAAPKAA